MKKIVYILPLLILVVLSACKKDIRPTNTTHQNNHATSDLDGKWNLIHMYGGIAGANENYAHGEIEWTFNTQNTTLTVNNTIGNSSYYSLPSGTYPFQQISNSNQNYLVIDANELGQFVISGNQIFIDENKKSTGEGACGFYLELER